MKKSEWDKVANRARHNSNKKYFTSTVNAKLRKIVVLKHKMQTTIKRTSTNSKQTKDSRIQMRMVCGHNLHDDKCQIVGITRIRHHKCNVRPSYLFCIVFLMSQ